MADVHDKATRSYNMSRIRGKNTTPEIVVRKFLFKNGIRYRIHEKSFPGKPDIVIGKYRTIIDVRGCFWHGHQHCKFGDEITSKSVGITERVKSAIERDRRNEEKWKELAWNVIVVWDSCELEVKKKHSEKREKLLASVLNEIRKSDTSNRPVCGTGWVGRGFLVAAKCG
jgi:DNA mismatch endonuclease, patch repair protein